jgi:hypothetical protein
MCRCVFSLFKKCVTLCVCGIKGVGSRIEMEEGAYGLTNGAVDLQHRIGVEGSLHLCTILAQVRFFFHLKATY